MSVLVLGGAGYIGSNAVDALIEKNYEVVVVDNLSTGYKISINKKAKFYEADIRDRDLLRHIFQVEKIDSVMHFAALSLGRESINNPLKYFNNNIYGTQIVLEVMNEFDVKHIVFSSSATVYGNSESYYVNENDLTDPLNPYGYSKIVMENMMSWVSGATGMTFVALRYFNVAGAKKDGTLGEVRPRLIPTILQVAQGRKEKMTLFGDSYKTKDGTCIRDYIHVRDLIEAHILSLEYLQNGGQSNIFNIGAGKGYSNLEIIETAREVTGHSIPLEIVSNVTGDADALIASCEKIKNTLGWEPQFSDIKEIIEDAWNWQKRYPNGYEAE
ncbi:UDP-glucose 4-epimerase [Lactococcus lactis]|uniref:UDP-glucose 4-epimerase n=1 Tax=Lactococcus lactis TaxID=1358 RepID=A0AAP8JD28_9LACT|nr:UDP-glucose 4-epimerase GalE [Lactococcus lactis]KSU09687.1 UDP-glucose 4-epimerase [Lactococcus lactis subsp. lactis]MDG4972480.1 UDP-glucose 4-epimerase GalE [Lactococcus lactis]MDU0401576.1 UDP-glucose 4-epimerase [Lactococcus lactis]PFG87297.1 UDP-glucose 4-epimerase GalE [Lactococcus lactis]